MSESLRRMRYFVAVAEELHFGRAAARLHIAQPPLSQAVRALERELGAALLERTTRRVRLTAAGEAYLAHARVILARADRAVEDVRRLAAGLSGRLVVGCVGSATYSLLPRFARAVRAELPDVDLVVRGEMSTGDQVAALHDGRIDLGLMRRPDSDAGLQVEQLRRDELLLALPTEHPLAGRDRVAIADLAGVALLLHPGADGSVMNRTVLAALARAGVQPGRTEELRETSAMLTFVAAGLGVAVLPEPATALGVEGVTWRALAGLEPLDLVRATRDAPDPHVRRAAELLARVSMSLGSRLRSTDGSRLRSTDE